MKNLVVSNSTYSTILDALACARFQATRFKQEVLLLGDGPRLSAIVESYDRQIERYTLALHDLGFEDV